MDRELIFKKILASKEYLERYGVVKIGIFGSYARNEQTESSDIDILIELNQPIGLEFMSIKFFLEGELGISVDLGTEAMLKEPIREQVLKEVIYL
jgi:uncharacterized protein